MTKSMTMTDVVRFELLAAAAGVSFVTLRRRYRAGMLPTPDLSIPAAPAYISAWRVSTLREWDPALGDRCAAMLAAMADAA